MVWEVGVGGIHTDSQMVLIAEELMWLVAEGQTQCLREKTLSHSH